MVNLLSRRFATSITCVEVKATWSRNTGKREQFAWNIERGGGSARHFYQHVVGVSEVPGGQNYLSALSTWWSSMPECTIDASDPMSKVTRLCQNTSFDISPTVQFLPWMVPLWTLKLAPLKLLWHSDSECCYSDSNVRSKPDQYISTQNSLFTTHVPSMHEYDIVDNCWELSRMSRIVKNV